MYLRHNNEGKGVQNGSTQYNFYKMKSNRKMTVYIARTQISEKLYTEREDVRCK